jgi:hypothetical protein
MVLLDRDVDAECGAGLAMTAPSTAELSGTDSTLVELL